MVVVPLSPYWRKLLRWRLTKRREMDRNQEAGRRPGGHRGREIGRRAVSCTQSPGDSDCHSEGWGGSGAASWSQVWNLSAGKDLETLDLLLITLEKGSDQGSLGPGAQSPPGDCSPEDRIAIWGWGKSRGQRPEFSPHPDLTLPSPRPPHHCRCPCVRRSLLYRS